MPLVIFSDDMESGPGGWEVSYQAPQEPPNKWYITEHFSHSGTRSWHYCEEEWSYADEEWIFSYYPGIGSIFNPVPVHGYLTSPEIDLTSFSFARLKFWHLLSCGDGLWLDWGRVEVTADGGYTWETIWDGVGTGSQWVEEEINLTPYLGKTIRIRFHFYSEDDVISPIYPGWFVDDFRVESLVDSAPDFDSDGLPDWWEIQYGLDPHDPSGNNGPDGDPDEDGFSNQEEYWCGTDPGNPESKPELGDVNFDGRINSADAILCLRIAVGLPIGSPPHTPSDGERFIADADGNSEVNAADGILILMKAVGLI